MCDERRILDFGINDTFESVAERLCLFSTDRPSVAAKRSIGSLHSTRAHPEARLIQLGVVLPSRVLPPATS